MIYPTTRGTQAKSVSGMYERIIRTGGPLPEKKCGCSAPVEPCYNSTERVNACLKGQSCIHIASRIVYVLVSRRWTLEQISLLASDCDNVGLAWLRVADDGELERLYERAVDSLVSVRCGPRKSRGKKSNGFVFHFSIFNRLLNAVAKNPGIGSRELRRLLCNSRFLEGHLHLYIKEARRRGYVVFTKGARNKRCHFVRTRPEPPQNRPFRDIRRGENVRSFVLEMKRHHEEHRQWWSEYDYFKATQKPIDIGILQALSELGDFC